MGRFSGVVIRGAGAAGKGVVKRSEREELALRIRILNGRHLSDAYDRVVAELGEDRASTIGPIDMSRNPLRSYVLRRGRAYLTPPLVQGLSEELAHLLGDMTATTTQQRYARADGRPMPTRMSMASSTALSYRLAANYSGTMIGWSDVGRRPFVAALPPDDLRISYASDDPLRPTVIEHYRYRELGGELVEVSEIYDLTDLDHPSYRILHDDDDVTAEVLGTTYEGDGYWWRYADGRPFHRIVIAGDPREVYRGISLVEGTLRMAALYTHWGAGIRDAGWPGRNSVGLAVDGEDSDAETGQTGISVGPENVVSWRHLDPERPGSLHQWGPGFDPEVIGRAIRTYELQLLSAMGLPVDYEQTGGEPTATEQAALAEVIASTYPECRGHDALVLRRAAAVHNRQSEATSGMDAAGLPELALSVLYREEIEDLLSPAGDPGGRGGEDD